MLGVNFYRRRLVHPAGCYVQDGECFICSGRWTSIYYPLTDEWFDIYNKAAPGTEAFCFFGSIVTKITLSKYLEGAGDNAFKRAVNCFLGRRIFNIEDSQETKSLEAKTESEYIDTDEFFADGPSEGFMDLKPPIIFGGIFTGEQNGED